MRTSSHHQPEAQHPKSPAIETPAGRLPHLFSVLSPSCRQERTISILRFESNEGRLLQIQMLKIHDYRPARMPHGGLILFGPQTLFTENKRQRLNCTCNPQDIRHRSPEKDWGNKQDPHRKRYMRDCYCKRRARSLADIHPALSSQRHAGQHGLRRLDCPRLPATKLRTLLSKKRSTRVPSSCISFRPAA